MRIDQKMTVDLNQLQYADLMDLKDFPDPGKVLDRPDWDDWLMTLAFVVSQRSCDPSTKHGAILSNNKHQILGVGYNGFPRGGDDCSLPTSRPLKYGYIIHAETNCVINSQNLMMSGDYAMHITGMPCSSCMLLMIQSGIKNIIYGPVTSACVDYKNIRTVYHLSNEYKVTMRYYGGPFLIKKMAEKHNYFSEVQENPFVIPERYSKEEQNDTEIEL